MLSRFDDDPSTSPRARWPSPPPATATPMWERGTRRAARAALTLETGDGDELSMELEPLLLFQMKGIGYGHPCWRHGSWLGELAVGHESFRPRDLDPLALENLHVQQLVRAAEGEQKGMGALEQVVLGPHRLDGFQTLDDGAP